MKRTAVVLSLLAAAACSDAPSTNPLGPASSRSSATIVTGDVIVTNSNDAGAGSLRDAIAQANANGGIVSIAFLPEVNTIWLQSGVVFTGSQDLAVHGNNAVIDGSQAGETAFTANGGGDLTVTDLTFRNAPGQGLEVEVPSGATGTLVVILRNVAVLGNTGHGFLVNDQEDPLDVTNPNGSAAGLDVHVSDSRFIGNGYSVSDRDGIRINEGGAGDLRFTIWNSRSDDNAADGIELDEKDVGDVIIDVRNLHVTRNGKFDPTDLDDGFDIDEAGDGDIRGQLVSSSANHNFEEGLDFNENDAGDLRVDLIDVVASFNREEGIDYEEDDDFAGGGDLVAIMDRVTTIGNGIDDADGGLKIREKGPGDLDVTLTNIIASQNYTSGIFVRETEAGNSRVAISDAATNGNASLRGSGDGIEIRESNAGSLLSAVFTNVTTSNNDRFGLSVDQGTANVSRLKGGANAAGLTGGGATFVVVP